MAQFDGRIIWRVQSTDSDARSKTFDALILSNDPALRPALGPPRLIGIRAPFEKELPDGDVTRIVRATDATVPLVSECDVLDSAGPTQSLWPVQQPPGSIRVFEVRDHGDGSARTRLRPRLARRITNVAPAKG